MKSYVHSIGGKARAEKIRKLYNSNPNYCKYCGKPLLYDGSIRLADLKRKKFCSKSCAASFNNKCRDDTYLGLVAYKKSKIQCLSDDYITKCYEDSVSVKDFMSRLGLKSNTLTLAVVYKLNELHLDIKGLRSRHHSLFLINTVRKGDLKDKYSYQCYRSFIQSNARSTYLLSDKPKVCCICGYDKYFEVAHIKPVSSFPDDCLIKDINNLQNLIALCPNHHWEYDNGFLSLDVKYDAFV